MGKNQVPMMPGRVGRHTALEPLNTPAGWGPSPNSASCEWQRFCWQTWGASPYLPLEQESTLSSIMGADSRNRPPSRSQASPPHQG